MVAHGARTQRDISRVSESALREWWNDC